MPTTKKTSKSSGSKPSVKVSDLKPSKDAKGGIASKRSESNTRIGRDSNARVGRKLD